MLIRFLLLVENYMSLEKERTAYLLPYSSYTSSNIVEVLRCRIF